MLPHPEPTVIFQKLGDGAVLFSPSTEIYFGLNEVGARVWELLAPTSSSVEVLCETLAREYPGVPLDVIRGDVEDLLQDLLRERLVRTTSGPHGEPAS